MVIALSLPTRECVLKLCSFSRFSVTTSHSLRGSVDWNFEYWLSRDCDYRHSLRGSVDWNRIDMSYCTLYGVTPYAGVWIEITKNFLESANMTSLPTRECGLKFTDRWKWSSLRCHSLCGSVDWNLFEQLFYNAVVCHSLCGSVDWNLPFE